LLCYQTNFNAPDYDLGPLPGQQGWINPVPGSWLDPTVEPAAIFSGQEVHAAASAAQIAGCARFLDGFGAGGTQWLRGSFASRQPLPYLSSQITDVGGAFASQLFGFGAILFYPDKIIVQDGANIVSTGVTFAPDEPHIVKAKIDFTTKTWDAYVDDMSTPKKVNLDLQDANINDIRGFIFFGVNGYGTKVMDDFFVGDFDPDLAIFRRRREV